MEPDFESHEYIPVACIRVFECIESENGCLIYDGNKIHFLNLTAYFILLSCDGKTSIGAMARSLEQAFGLATPPLADVTHFLSELKAIGFISR